MVKKANMIIGSTEMGSGSGKDIFCLCKATVVVAAGADREAKWGIVKRSGPLYKTRLFHDCFMMDYPRK